MAGCAESKSPKKCPNAHRFWCRKQFYAVNVQIVSDSLRRVLYVAVDAQGSAHDSTAFGVSSLFKYLEKAWNTVLGGAFTLIGDAAYPLRSFLMTPTADDDVNFYLSQSRIAVECCIGMLVNRFGVFWRKLRFELHFVGDIIIACAILHNLIICYHYGLPPFADADGDSPRVAQRNEAVDRDIDRETAIRAPGDVREGSPDVHFFAGSPATDGVRTTRQTPPSSRSSSVRESPLRDEIVARVHRWGLTRPEKDAATKAPGRRTPVVARKKD